MDFATIFGIGLGAAVIMAALGLGGVPMHLLFQPEALVIVFGGTITALLINFSFAEMKSAIGMISWALHQEDLTVEDIVDYLTDAAIYIRSKGALAVQPLLSHVDIPFLQKGLQLIVDNQPISVLKSQLTTELEVQYRIDNQHARVFEAAAGFAPTMGIIGAVIGLIHVTGMLNEPEKLGQGVAGAFIATLYGVGLANLFLLPLAGKLKQRAKDEWFLKTVMLQGLIAIQEGLHPTLVREQLQAFIHPGMTEGSEEYEQEETERPIGLPASVANPIH